MQILLKCVIFATLEILCSQENSYKGYMGFM